MKILLVDDNETIRRMIKRLFEGKKYEFLEADTMTKALDLLKNEFDLIISDLKLPDGEGTEILKYRNDNDLEAEIIIITAYGDVETAVNAMKEGAFDFIIKPLNIDEFEVKVDKALEKKQLKNNNVKLQETINYIIDEDAQEFEFNNIIGRSSQIKEVMDLIKRVSRSDAAVLIEGESGVGKELVARAIHYSSNRKDKPFVKVNCAVFSEGILESELFGHEKGSFTGALSKRLGRFEIADEGTIFLDEIGDLPMNTQVKLLQVLQEYTFERVGGNEPIKVNVRVISATNQNLKEKITQGMFREDLYYRINVVPIFIPPLRDRVSDLEMLTNYFVDKFTSISKKDITGITKEAMEIFMNYSWPGNIRELEHTIERMVVLSERSKLGVPDIPADIVSKKGINIFNIDDYKGDLRELIDDYERSLIQHFLKKFSGKQEVANRLNISLSTLYNKMEKHGLN